jgi:hypothetical protein
MPDSVPGLPQEEAHQGSGNTADNPKQPTFPEYKEQELN